MAAPLTDPLAIPCPGCEQRLLRVETVRERGVVIDVYQCPEAACGRKAVVVFEPGGSLTDDDRGWVEREVARRGAFFPADYAGQGGPGRLR